MEVRKCGASETSFEPPDIVHLKLVGSVTMDECLLINEAHLTWGQDRSHVFYMIDLSELADIPAAVRRAASETVKLLPLRGTVIYNSPLRARVLGKLLLTAGNLFRRGAAPNPVEFVDTEIDARTWVSLRRRQITEE
jgi:hypothetical protein